MNRLLLLAILLGLLSCSKKPVFEYEKVFEQGNWAQADSISFEIPVTDTTSSHDLVMLVSHKPDFDYQNLYLKVRTTFPEGEAIENILPIDLADKFGNWEGDCNNDVCNTEIILRKSFRFQLQGKYAFDFIQYSRDETLDKIKSLKLALYQIK